MKLICRAGYEVNAQTQTYTWRTVSARTKSWLLDEARRRGPAGNPLVIITRVDDAAILWQADGGWTPAADEPHDYNLWYTLFRDIAIGQQFFTQLLPTVPETYFIKISGTHARRVDDPSIVVELDQYDKVN